uniref:Uncharacterized protein n=1 Tax=Trichogramma kaykai TaxID=54128 RepID=A0ABD2VWU2_9HYME
MCESSFNQIARARRTGTMIASSCNIFNNSQLCRGQLFNVNINTPAASCAPTRHVADPAMLSSYIHSSIRHSMYIFYSANILAEIALDDEDEDEDDEPPWMHYYCCYYFYTRRAQRAFDAIVLVRCLSRASLLYTAIATIALQQQQQHRIYIGIYTSVQHTRVYSVVARAAVSSLY